MGVILVLITAFVSAQTVKENVPEVAQSTETVVVTSPTHTLSPSATHIPTQVVVEQIEEPTPIPTLQPTEEPENISLQGIYTVTVQSDAITDWYRSFFKELKVELCQEPCTAEQIMAQLGKQSDKEWVAVQHGRVLYVHSGWSITSGPEFGEILLRVHNSGDLKSAVICLEERRCFQVVDLVLLGRGSIGDNISTGELFSVEHGDYFIVTCSERLIPGLETPKLILQIRKIE
ncbi:hypothetical protein CVU76_02400 [Candidatus Dojkabacteria bacterium HGW-Dojkabacteria-1]|uniref:Uncharacterized protein n=1 Tax=Candidatus Dojkabacteria bacterium HGW-Dojkabacteria-1 TaxID=2013761 RepID=A0A2N2F3S2_9BACT|nr:MAG: hypothetical protein CVU76_02400 [Candidatus Dojkabacteria bacterium HGW-Dojkabacteria-1]